MTNNKQQAKQCKSELCCKATASLKEQVDAELKEKDKSLKGILDGRCKKQADKTSPE